jgi:hypothetical protein
MRSFGQTLVFAFGLTALGVTGAAALAALLALAI